MSLISNFFNFYSWAESIADERVKEWLFISSPMPTILIVTFYLIFVTYLGPKVMKNHPAVDLGWLLPAYNFFLVALNYHIAKELILGSWNAGYSLKCQPINIDPNDLNELRIANAIWWYYFSKLIELIDTVCFVLRKRDRQITLLHVYHHSTMPLLWWIGAKWVPGGQSFFGAICNSSIHVLMYTYYALAAFGPKVQKFLWWKKYLTMLQLIQFIVVVIHATISIFVQCDFPAWMNWALMFYMFSMITLFGNFYRQEYVNKARQNEKKNQFKKKN